MDSSNNGSNSKRQAMTGQWRTPPLPAFAAEVHQAHVSSQHVALAPQPSTSAPASAPIAPHPVSHAGAPVPIQIVSQPNTAMSMTMPTGLEEIPLPESTDDYAKALQEAYRRGAEAAARLQQQQQMSTSCPNLQQLQQAQPHDPTQNLNAPIVPNPLAGQVHAPQMVAPAPLPPMHPVQPPQPMPQPMPQHVASPHVAAASAGNRSVSLPDMQSYAARAQAEEEKRKKRLARNRASARLRRLRKKNLVDSYEGEVGVLESSLKKLKGHTWGSSHEALLEALGMERGQQELSNDERINLIQEIVDQQRKQVEFIRETQREQQVLLSLVENPEDELSMELQSLLNLTDGQKEDIRHACRGLQKEVEAMETFIQCLDAMKDTSWLWNEGVSQISKQFTSILHANQLSKFLIWTDTNAEALDTLQYCHAPPSQAPPAGAPVFVFGMDDHSAQTAIASQGNDSFGAD